MNQEKPIKTEAVEQELDEFYRPYYHLAVKIARKYGYCAALHGSMKRDLDIVLVPWTEDAKNPIRVLIAIKNEVNGLIVGKGSKKCSTQKPHGRYAYTILIDPRNNFGLNGRFYDISIIPRLKDLAPNQRQY